MTTAVHGCGSPRQHGGNISTSNACLAGGTHHHPQNTTPLPMYAIPKYTRSSTQQQLTILSHHVGAGGHPHLSNPNSYFPVASTAAQHSIHSTFSHSTYRPQLNSTTSEICRNYWSNHPHSATLTYRSGRYHGKRKSAVELLAESKQFYIKSHSIMERLHSNYRAVTAAEDGSKPDRNMVEARDDIRCSLSYGDNVHATDTEHRCGSSGLPRQSSGGTHMHHHHHHGHHSHIGRRNIASGNNVLQSNFRIPLSADTHRDRVVSNLRAHERYKKERPFQYEFSNTSKTNSGIYSEELLNTGFNNGDDSKFKIPPPYLSPQHFENVCTYGIDDSSGDEPLILTENYRPISPPAEYAADVNLSTNEHRSRYNYKRSYSHSHEMAAEHTKYNNDATYNINSHKSLPDLHTQISRHSPHSEILSCCSRGNRSIKSAGESSLNRDSGGSSGHYTHRSEPCYKQREIGHDMFESKNYCNATAFADFRRDSGSSTQHSVNTYCGYVSPSYSRTVECIDCRCRHNANGECFESADYLFNFTTPEVPEAFQDDYTPPSPNMLKYKTEATNYSSSSNLQNSQAHVAGQSQIPNLQSPGSIPSTEDISPPPIQFKRQRCIRFKNRSRITLPKIPRPEKSTPESDKVYCRTDRETRFFPKCFSVDGYNREVDSMKETFPNSVLQEKDNTPESQALLELENFFDRLGLNDDKFHEIYSLPKKIRSNDSDSDHSSTVFFSDVSTVDSMRLPDSTESQPQTTQNYRPSDPPSIVERNARIIKWLCNCKRLQLM